MLTLCFIGILWNTIFINISDAAEVEDWSLTYFLWGIGGLFSGFGLGAFPLIINVLYWSPRKKGGRN